MIARGPGLTGGAGDPVGGVGRFCCALAREMHTVCAVPNRVALTALLVALSAAGGFALLQKAPAPPEPAAQREPAPPRAADPSPHGAEPSPHGDPQALPPGHPPVGASGGMPRARVAPPTADEPGVLTWTAPEGWQTAPNPSTMRLATYRIAHVGKDTEDAELSVSRAGGGTDANIQRWVGQFDDAGKDTRATRTVRGLKVTTVEVSGSYQGGGMMGGAAKKTGWSLLGAIVETQGSSYFFKMVGPTATVQSARGAFNKMLDSIAPK